MTVIIKSDDNFFYPSELQSELNLLMSIAITPPKLLFVLEHFKVFPSVLGGVANCLENEKYERMFARNQAMVAQSLVDQTVELIDKARKGKMSKDDISASKNLITQIEIYQSEPAREMVTRVIGKKVYRELREFVKDSKYFSHRKPL